MIRAACLALILGVSAPVSIAQTLAQRSFRSSDHSAVSLAEIREIETDLQSGRFRDAQAKAHEVVKKQPTYAPAWVYLGIASVRLDEPAQAIQAFERAIAIDPRDPRPFLDVALLYASRNELDKAIDRYQKGLLLDPTNNAAYYNYGRLLISKGRFGEARDALERAVQLSPTDSDARTALVEALLRVKQGKEAMDQVRILLEIPGITATSLVSLGALLVRGREVVLAKDVLTRALSMAPYSAAVHLELSRLYLSQNDHQNATRAAQHAVELTPRSLEANLALAEAYISGRQNLQALEHLLKIEDSFKDSAALHYTLGIARFRINQYQPAIVSFKRAVQLDPRMDLAHFLLGNASLSTGDLEQAETSLKAAIFQNPNQVLYYNYLARVYEKKGDAFEGAAREATQKALNLDPKDLEGRERLAKWAKEEGDLASARALLEEVIRDDPSFISARVLLASVYYHLNLRQEADDQQQAVRILEAEAQKRQRSPTQR
jgi:tetratricopeptide (TPR) repeat protein